MAQKILVRRGSEAERQSIAIAPLAGEILWTTDNKELFVGDGIILTGQPLGYLSLREGGTIAADLAISGNLTVSGTTTTTTSNDVIIGDSIIVLNNNSAATPVDDAGIEIERGDSTNVSILWKEGVDQWEIDDGTSSRRLLDTNDIQTSGDFTLDGLNDTTISANSVGEILKWTGSAWENNTLSEAGIQAQSALLDDIAGFSATAGLLSSDGAGNITTDTTTYGEITSITSGSGLTGGGTSGVVDLAVGAGTGITVNADTIQVADNGISALQLNVAGDGTGGNVLTSDGDGTFTWSDAGAATNNAVVTFEGSGGITTTLGDISMNQASDETITIAHLTTDGNKHVTATSTTNDGNVLTAGATAGTFSWAAPQQVSTDVTLGGTPDYLTLSNQVLTLTKLDISDDTNIINTDGSILISGNDISVDTVDGGSF